MIVIRIKKLLYSLFLTFAAVYIIMTAVRFTFPEIMDVLGKNGSEQRTLVIDAGHGGMDGGASGISGVTEKDINLAIAERLRKLCALCGVPAAMTRDSDVSLAYRDEVTVRSNKVADLRERRRIAESFADPVFLSIHLNKFSDSKYSGAQTFYSINNPEGKLLAECIQASLISSLDPDNTRTAKAADSSIYLMKNLRCPAIIVECGFLSNANEEVLLQTADYQKKIACAVMNGYASYISDKTGQEG